MCKDEGIKIPYEKCGPEIAPSVTGNAIVQHLAKLRKKIEKGGTDEGGKSFGNSVGDPDDSNDSYNPSPSHNAAMSTKSTNKRGCKRNKQSQATQTAEGGVENKMARLEESLNKKRLGDEDSDEDEEYVAADSNLVIKEEVESEEGEQDSEDTSGKSGGCNGLLVKLRIPDQLKGLVSKIESGQYHVASGTKGPQHAMGEPDQVADIQDSSRSLTSGMYHFDPTFFPDPAVVYPTDLQLPVEQDMFLGESYGYSFFDQGLGFPEMGFSNSQATFADFDLEQAGQLEQSDYVAGNATAPTATAPGRRAHQRSHPVDVRFDAARKNYYDVSGNYY